MHNISWQTQPHHYNRRQRKIRWDLCKLQQNSSLKIELKVPNGSDLYIYIYICCVRVQWSVTNDTEEGLCLSWLSAKMCRQPRVVSTSLSSQSQQPATNSTVVRRSPTVSPSIQAWPCLCTCGGVIDSLEAGCQSREFVWGIIPGWLTWGGSRSVWHHYKLLLISWWASLLVISLTDTDIRISLISYCLHLRFNPPPLLPSAEKRYIMQSLTLHSAFCKSSIHATFFLWMFLFSATSTTNESHDHSWPHLLPPPLPVTWPHHLYYQSHMTTAETLPHYSTLYASYSISKLDTRNFYSLILHSFQSAGCGWCFHQEGDRRGHCTHVQLW